jgi:hypothetical protein
MDQVVSQYDSAAQGDTARPDPVDGIVRFLRDLKRFQGRRNGAWVSLSGDVTLGDAYLAAVTILPDTSSWLDVATVTATATGRAVTCRWNGSGFNGASGADRTTNWRVVYDTSTVLGSFTGVSYPQGAAVGLPHVFRSAAYKHTPSAASHTWKLQAQASIASACYAETGWLAVVETD